MAHALAAMCPPLQTADVLQAADKMTDQGAMPGIVVIDGLFRSDVDRVNLRNVIEALQALYDFRTDTPPRSSD